MKRLILNSLHRSGALGLARLLNRGQFSGCRVVNFHRVLPAETAPDHYASLMGEPTGEELDHLIGYLRRWFRFTTPAECLNRWRGGREVDPYSLILTFDDGYADLHRNLLPVLRKWEVPATIFLTTGGMHGRQLWFQRLFGAIVHTPHFETPPWLGVPSQPLDTPRQRANAIITLSRLQRDHPAGRWEEAVEDLALALDVPSQPPGEEMLTWEQVAQMQASELITFGGHTVTHPMLSQCTPERAQREIEESASDLRAHLGDCLLPFAYPNGGHNAAVERMVDQAGYGCAFAMTPAVNTRATPRFRLGRQYLQAGDVAAASFALSGLRRSA